MIAALLSLAVSLWKRFLWIVRLPLEVKLRPHWPQTYCSCRSAWTGVQCNTLSRMYRHRLDFTVSETATLSTTVFKSSPNTFFQMRVKFSHCCETQFALWACPSHFFGRVHYLPPLEHHPSHCSSVSLKGHSHQCLPWPSCDSWDYGFLLLLPLRYILWHLTWLNVPTKSCDVPSGRIHWQCFEAPETTCPLCCLFQDLSHLTVLGYCMFFQSVFPVFCTAALPMNKK